MSDFDKTNSTSDLSGVSSEQLFTELTPEQAAVIEGGLSLYIDKIEAIRTGADALGRDDVYINANGNKIWGGKKGERMRAGDTKSVETSFSFDGSATIDLFDRDPGKDDFLGSFTVNSVTNGTTAATVSLGQLSASEYKVFYTVA